MKSLRILTVITCTLAWFAASANIQAETCCEAAKKAGKACDHKCCVEAAKNKKVCEKCNPKKEEKPDDKKD